MIVSSLYTPLQLITALISNIFFFFFLAVWCRLFCLSLISGSKIYGLPGSQPVSGEHLIKPFSAALLPARCSYATVMESLGL